MLLNGNEMKLGACEFSMLTFAELTTENLVLVYHRFISITQKAIMEIVHLRFFQGIDQILEFHKVKD
jgi:hypothetical protein